MERLTQAKEFIKRFYEIRPKRFFKQLDDNDKGLFAILHMLINADGEVVAGDIANELAMSTPRVAAALKTLEGKGFAVRTPSQTDRRKTVVCITDDGKRAVREGESAMLELVEYIFQTVGDGDMYEFLRISEKITAAIDERALKLPRKE